MWEQTARDGYLTECSDNRPVESFEILCYDAGNVKTSPEVFVKGHMF